ncbi:hypothetical protein HYC85_029010 [Camellia sinensis]|uniref:Uncharacterized protein n=1 Tax=Camellia sinensis TaxID=4442 RepID=A0A7J7FX12_CAMSI|nr:hypothetical protein HYC85_029010 [Camellia sinensis]
MWNSESKTLEDIIGSQQMSSDKSGIGYGDATQQKESLLQLMTNGLKPRERPTRTESIGAIMESINVVVDDTGSLIASFHEEEDSDPQNLDMAPQSQGEAQGKDQEGQQAPTLMASLSPKSAQRDTTSTRWIFKNKSDENDTVVRNKARHPIFDRPQDLDVISCFDFALKPYESSCIGGFARFGLIYFLFHIALEKPDSEPLESELFLHSSGKCLNLVDQTFESLFSGLEQLSLGSSERTVFE